MSSMTWKPQSDQSSSIISDLGVKRKKPTHTQCENDYDVINLIICRYTQFVAPLKFLRYYSRDVPIANDTEFNSPLWVFLNQQYNTHIYA